MNRDEFRQRMNNYKKARESNPSLSYWSWKANKYQDGTGGITPYSAGSLVDAIYQATSNEKYLGKPTHNYDVTISEEEANRLGYYPDERGHRDDRVKKVAHPTHPSRGNWKSFNQFDLTDFGMETPNYTLFGVNDGGQDPQAILTYKKGVVIPEITVTPKGNYYFNSYDNIKRYADGTDEITNTTLPEVVVTPKRKQNNSESDIQDSPYQDLHYQYEAKPRYELRKGIDKPTRYTSPTYIKGLKGLSKSFGLLGILTDIPQYLFPDKETEILENLRTNIQLQNDILLGKKKPIEYENGTDGIVDELKSNTRTTLTPEEQRYLLDRSRQRQRMSGTITPVFDIQDAADLTPIGDVLTARDAYNAVQDRDYIKASAMLGLMLAPPALGRIAKEKIPSFVTAAADKINELRRRERRNKELDTKIFSQGIEDRNRIIEELYDTPGIWDRAYNTDITYGTNYVDTYDNLINNYYSNYFNLPEPIRKDIGDAQAMMSAKPEAIRRYNDEGIPASWSDFAYYINPSIENLDKALTRHEMGHYVDFNMSKSNNADRGNLMFDELRKDLSVDPNPLIPNKTDYFRQGTEQKSYMNTLRQFMFDNNMINRIDDQVTQKQIKEAINKLPSELKSVKAAYQQFKSPRKYTKWFNTIPLLSTIPFIYNYSQEKDSN